MEEAASQFNHHAFGGGAFNFIARYDHDKHWMLMTGFGFNSFGYEYSLSQNYSLFREEEQYSVQRLKFSSIEIPTLIHYKFDPNCKNSKWVIGAGFAHTIIGLQTKNAN